MKSIMLALVISCQLQQSEQSDYRKHVAVILDKDQPAIIMKQIDAENAYNELLKHNKDPKLFAALTISLGKIPDTVHCTLWNNCVAVDQIKQHCEVNK